MKQLLLRTRHHLLWLGELRMRIQIVYRKCRLKARKIHIIATTIKLTILIIKAAIIKELTSIRIRKFNQQQRPKPQTIALLRMNIKNN